MKNFILLTLILCQSVFAVPSLINYQGRLTDPNGDPLTGNKIMSVSIYDAATEGTSLYTEEVGSISLDSNGIYSFSFGTNQTALTSALQTAGEHWLELTVDGTSQTPRERILSVPFAQVAVNTPPLEAKVASLFSKIIGILDSKFTVNINHQLDERVWEGEDLINGTMSFDINGLVTVLQLGYRIDGGSGSANGMEVSYQYEDGSEEMVYSNYELDTSGFNQRVNNPFPTKRVESLVIKSIGGYLRDGINYLYRLGSGTIERSANFDLEKGEWIIGLRGLHSDYIDVPNIGDDPIGRFVGANRFLEMYDFIINFLDENNDTISSINLADSPLIKIDQDVFVSKIIISYAPKQNPILKTSTAYSRPRWDEPQETFLKDIIFVKF